MAHMPAYTGFPLNTPNTRRHFMTTPYDSFNEWFTRLPLKYRQDLASEIAALLPGMEVNPYHRKFLDDFSAQLDGIRKKGHREEYGLILCLKTLIDHIINEKNQANSGWEKEKAELDEMARMTGSCSMATHASELAMQHSQWKTIGEMWQALASHTLTPQAIENWRRSVSPSAHIL